MNLWGNVTPGSDPTEYRVPCEKAYEDSLVWKRRHRVHCAVKRFTYWSVFKDEYGCYMNSKGHAARVLSVWLESVVEEVLLHPPGHTTEDFRARHILVALPLSFEQETCSRLLFLARIIFVSKEHKTKTSFSCPNTSMCLHPGPGKASIDSSD